MFSCLFVWAAAAQTPPPGRSAPPSEQQTFALTAHRRLLWLRASDGPSSELELQVERALARTLTELGYFPDRSPLPFRDAQLASGCVGGLRECGARVASALDSEQLLVSAVQSDGDARTARLVLHRFQADQPAKSGSAVLPLSPAEELELTVRALAESVFETGVAGARVARGSTPAALPAQSGAAAAEPSAEGPEQPSHAALDPRGSPALRGVGWTAVGLGAAGAIGAIATALSAAHQGDAYSRAKLSDPDAVDRALSHYDRAQQQSEVARILGGVSAGVVAAGAFMLTWEYLKRRQDRNLQPSLTDKPQRADIRLAAWPHRAGAMVSLRVGL